MKHTIEGNPDYGQLTLVLGPGEKILAESGAMSWMSEGMVATARMLGGLGKALFRKLAGGESFFVVEYEHPTGGSITLSPYAPGTVAHRTLRGETFTLTGSSFLACTPGITMSTLFGGMKSLFSGEGAFFLKCEGTGELYYNTFGAMLEKQVDGTFIVDSGHVVAWDQSLTYTIQGMGGLKSTLLSGEGLALKFTGVGKVYLQTRTISGTASWLTPFNRT
ncbi:MAG: TIGR00266 family protein [SAR202 cluster bacterium]|nr:TIGR00266 family protein [SAR202 cluster bacterium]